MTKTRCGYRVSAPGTTKMLRPARLWLAAGAFALASAAGARDIDHDEARVLRERGIILPLAEILDRNMPRPGARLIEAELEREHGRLIYELEYLSGGEVYKLRIDAVSGAALPQERD